MGTRAVRVGDVVSYKGSDRRVKALRYTRKLDALGCSRDYDYLQVLIPVFQLVFFANKWVDADRVYLIEDCTIVGREEL